ncbi:hypothetical protein OB13_05155 [Pontibacter sp. HJ8]
MPVQVLPGWLDSAFGPNIFPSLSNTSVRTAASVPREHNACQVQPEVFRKHFKKLPDKYKSGIAT